MKSEDGTFGYIEAGLPNITGSFTYISGAGLNGTGAFQVNPSLKTALIKTSLSGETYNYDFSAFRCSPIYSDDITTVQPPSVKIRVKTRFK